MKETYYALCFATHLDLDWVLLIYFYTMFQLKSEFYEQALFWDYNKDSLNVKVNLDYSFI